MTQLSWMASQDDDGNGQVSPVHGTTDCFGEPSPAHDTTGFACWCKPRVEQICGECDGESEECWRCDGQGTVLCDNPYLYDGPHGLLVIHNDVRP